MSKSLNLKKHMARAFDLPEEIILDTPVIKIISNNELTIENHKGILEYSSNLVIVNSTLGAIKVMGDRIQIKEIDDFFIIIFGEIYSLEYMR